MTNTLKTLLGLLLLICTVQATRSFPQLASVRTTRDVASRYSAEWDIRHKESRRLDEETVDLSLVVHSEEEVAQLNELAESAYLTYELLEEEPDQRQLEGINNMLFCYRTVEETYASMEDLANQYPDLVRVETIGQSYFKQQKDAEGYDIKVLVIGVNATMEKTDMVVVGGHHSRELPPPETLMRWGEHLIDQYDKDPDITWILQRSTIHIIPIANPDGRQIVQDHLNWYYRKNAHPNNCERGPERYGVDLNRNYPMFWGDLSGASDSDCSADYHGTGPLSEPESSAVYTYASALFDESMKKGTADEALNKRDEACPMNASGIFMDVHSNGDMVYFPWGYEDETCPNHLSFLTMASKLASPGDFRLWAPDQEGFLYGVSGDATDSMYGIDCVFSVGYEIGSEMYASCTELKSTIVPTMIQSLSYAAKCIRAPYLLPLGPDVLSITVNITDPTAVSVVVEVSDEELIVDHAKYQQEANRSQPITEVRVFVDEHPEDANASQGALMNPQDGAFDSVDEVAILSLDLSNLQGQHVLYFQAQDAHGYVGPVSAAFVELPEFSDTFSDTSVTVVLTNRIGEAEEENPKPGESNNPEEEMPVEVPSMEDINAVLSSDGLSWRLSRSIVTAGILLGLLGF